MIPSATRIFLLGKAEGKIRSLLQSAGASADNSCSVQGSRLTGQGSCLSVLTFSGKSSQKRFIATNEWLSLAKWFKKPRFPINCFDTRLRNSYVEVDCLFRVTLRPSTGKVIWHSTVFLLYSQLELSISFPNFTQTQWCNFLHEKYQTLACNGMHWEGKKPMLWQTKSQQVAA